MVHEFAPTAISGPLHEGEAEIHALPTFLIVDLDRLPFPSESRSGKPELMALPGPQLWLPIEQKKVTPEFLNRVF